MLYVSLVCARFSRASSPGRGNRGTKMGISLGDGLPCCQFRCASVGGTRGLPWGGGVATVVGVHRNQCCTPILHARLGEGVGDCRGAVVVHKMFLGYLQRKETMFLLFEGHDFSWSWSAEHTSEQRGAHLWSP